MSLSVVTPIHTVHVSTSTSLKWTRSRSLPATFSSWRKRVKIVLLFYDKAIYQRQKNLHRDRNDGDRDDEHQRNDGTSHDHDQNHATTSTTNVTTNANGPKSTGKGAKKRRGGVVIDDEEAESEENEDEDDLVANDSRPPAPLLFESCHLHRIASCAALTGFDDSFKGPGQAR
jgi:hypothetical protein